MKGHLVLLMTVAAFPLMAQDKVWTLQECIEYAIENNISVQQSSISVEEKSIALNSAQSEILPGVSANGSQNWSFGRGLTADNTYDNANTTSTSLSLGANMPLFNGFQIKNGITMSELDLEAAISDLEKAKDDIRVAVAQAYVQILFDKEILSVAENQIEIDRQQLERLAAMEKAGLSSSVEVSAQKSSLAQSELTATQAKNNLSIAVLELTQLLELESPEGFDIVSPSLEAFEPGLLMNPEEVYARAVEIKPQIKSENTRLAYAQTNINLKKGAYLPSLSLSGGLGTNYYTSSNFESATFGYQVKNNFSQYVGLSLSIPLFSKFSIRNNVRVAELGLRNQELQLLNVKKTLYKEIQQAYYNAEASQSKYNSCIFAKQSAEESFNLYKAKYESGKATITEFNEAKNNMLKAESDLVQAKYEYLFQSRLLDFYGGQDIMF